MYSPKIREDLIPRIYQAAKKAKLPMTAWVNTVLESVLSTEDRKPTEEKNRNNGSATNGQTLNRKD